MASYQKYVMMGVTMILIPLGKVVLKKKMGKLTEESEQDSADAGNGEFTTTRRPFAGRA